jgi:phosphoribosylpyrophosphate synthetase
MRQKNISEKRVTLAVHEYAHLLDQYFTRIVIMDMHQTEVQ